MKQNLHTHSTYCDGKSTIKEMIRSALMKEFDVLGFSGHSFTDFDKSYCMSEDGIIDYLDEITEAKKLFIRDQEAGKLYYAPGVIGARDLQIYLGIEQDLYSSQKALRKLNGLFNTGETYGTFDYIIGSVHAFRITKDELSDMGVNFDDLERPDTDGVVFTDDSVYIYADYDEDSVKWAIDKVFKGDPMGFCRAYFKDEGRIVDVTDCDIVGHFDLLLKFNERDKIFDEEDPIYIEARDKALDQIFSSFRSKGMDPIFEVNTGAMARGLRTVPYPSLSSLRAIKERGGKLVINTDCHQSRLLDYGISDARDLILNEGFREVINDQIVTYI